MGFFHDPGTNRNRGPVNPNETGFRRFCPARTLVLSLEAHGRCRYSKLGTQVTQPFEQFRFGLCNTSSKVIFWLVYTWQVGDSAGVEMPVSRHSLGEVPLETSAETWRGRAAEEAEREAPSGQVKLVAARVHPDSWASKRWLNS